MVEDVYKKAVDIGSKITDRLFYSDYDIVPEIVSVNFPFELSKKTKIEIVSKINKKSYTRLFELKDNKYVHQRPYVNFGDAETDSDLEALKNKKISLTPLSINLVQQKQVDNLKEIFK